jgi:hypothetical protein
MARESPLPAEERHLAPVGVPRLALSLLDQAAVSAFVTGDPGEVAALVEDARQLAEALAGDDGDAARVRLLARAASAARTQQRVLEVMLGDRLAKRDAQGVELVTRALDGVTKRLTALMKQLSAESAVAKRPAVFIGHADEVNLRDGR